MENGNSFGETRAFYPRPKPAGTRKRSNGSMESSVTAPHQGEPELEVCLKILSGPLKLEIA